jgi:hypothetical protein
MTYSSTLRMGVTSSSETSDDFQRTTRRYVPQDRILHNHKLSELPNPTHHEWNFDLPKKTLLPPLRIRVGWRSICERSGWGWRLLQAHLQETPGSHVWESTHRFFNGPEIGNWPPGNLKTSWKTSLDFLEVLFVICQWTIKPKLQYIYTYLNMLDYRHKLGCVTNLKVHFLHSHLFYLWRMGKISLKYEENGEEISVNVKYERDSRWWMHIQSTDFRQNT